MSDFIFFQFVLFVSGTVILVGFSFYVEALDKKGSDKKEPYLKVLKILIVLFSLWFIFSGFYFKFFTGYFPDI
ncbi:MAG: hypothetical protein ACR2NW_09455 [Thermodesulfobacteriota bacterium]